MKRLGSVILIAGAVLVIVSDFLRYFTDSSLTVWQITTRYPVVLTVLAGLAIVMAVICFPGERALPLGVAAALGAFLLGEAFPVWTTSYHYKIGFWMAVGGSALMVAGGLLALRGGVRSATEPALGFMPAVSTPAAAWPTSAPTPQPVAAAAQAATTSTWAGRIATPRAETSLVTPRAETSLATTAVLPPAGWYPDPAGAGGDRYWSGQEWTRDVRGA